MIRRHRSPLVAIACVIAACSSVPRSQDEAAASGTAPTPAPPSPGSPGPKVRVVADTRVVERFDRDENDLDLFHVLSVDLGEAASDRWTAHASARSAWDIDGRNGPPST